MQRDQATPMKMGYDKFAAMIAVSTALMYGMMFLNVYEVGHLEYSQTRMWMAIVMGAAMAFVMIIFMWGMYKNRRTNWLIVSGSIVVFAGALWLVRSQETVDDVSYMKAMIPHHSIAILTSERAHIKDQRVRHLADGIIRAQVKEIDEMRALIAELEKNPPTSETQDLLSYRQRNAPAPLPE